MEDSQFVDSKFLAEVRQHLAQHTSEQKRLAGEIASLEAKKAKTSQLIASLESIIAIATGERPDTQNEAGTSTFVPPIQVPGRTSPNSDNPRKPKATANDVVELLMSKPGPMHYRKIHEEILARGFEIGGKGNADTLLSRFFKDPRLTRVSRGTYQFGARREGDAKDQPTDSSV